MKRSFFYCFLGALALTSCVSEDVKNDDVAKQKAIGFENVADKFTRAEDLTYSSLKKFHVFGYYTKPEAPNKAVQVFYDVPVTRQDNGTWDYKTQLGDYRYWVPNAHYYFHAYSCGSVSKLNTDAGLGSFSMNMQDDLSASDRVLKINGYLCDASHQHDLVYASNTGNNPDDVWEGIIAQATGNPTVEFHFKHLLTKVSAQFTNNLPAGYTAEISRVTIENIRNIGDYSPTAEGGWQNQQRTDNGQPFVYLLNTTDPSIDPVRAEKGASCTTQHAYVIPFAYNGTNATEGTASTWVYIKFTLTIYHGTDKINVRELTGKFNPSWKAGYSYVYNITLTGLGANFQAIAFATATDTQGNVIDPWGDDPDADRTILIDSNESNNSGENNEGGNEENND